MHNPTKTGDWVTNHPRTLKAYWPRRQAEYKEGPPKETEVYTQEELSNSNIIGIYLAEDIEDGLKSRPIIQNDKPNRK